MHKTFTIALVSIALIGWNSNALADGSPSVVVHAPSRPGAPPLIALRTGRQVTIVERNDAEDVGLTKIAGNLTRYPNSPYYGWLGYAICGPQGGCAYDAEQWLAVAFTPNTNHLATKVEVPAEYYQGTNGVALSIYDDADGVPGKPLHTWHLTNLPHGPCCTLASGSYKPGISLGGGKQYWVVLRTSHFDLNSVTLWTFTEYASVQKHFASMATYCSGAGCANLGLKDHGWKIFSQMLYGLAFSVLGR
ncbi:MAG TPA: hypothetical protein VGI19_07060 [Candidatus Cybelea sp.]|jgi:hypothetical protein